MSELLVCPTCKNILTKKDNKLICDKCGKESVVEGKLYDFMGSTNYYWGEIPLDEMEKALEIAKNSGWKSVIKNHANLTDYIIGRDRIDWLFHCIDYSNTGACLDIGSGWGAISFGLVRYYSEVWSLEAVKQRVLFQKIRQEQDNIDNIKFVRTDWLHLPFPDNYFDLVAVNGVLEWVGLSDYSKNPRDVQVEFLKEIRRVLKPTGCLYIGIENRFALSSFLGGLDHSGLRFTSIVPRKLADWIIRFARKSGLYEQQSNLPKWGDYRTYNYSLAGLQKLLKEANYNWADYYWTYPNYNLPIIGGRFCDDSYPFFLKMPRNNTKPTNYIRSFGRLISPYFLKSLLKWLNCHFSESFLIFAYKETKPNSFELNLLNTQDHNIGFLRISYEDSMDSKINYFILRDNEAVFVIKFPRERINVALAQEEALLARFNGINLKKQIVDSVPLFIEPVLPGVKLRPRNLSHNKKALAWLQDFQNQTQKGIWNAEDLENEIDELDNFLMNLELQENIKIRTFRRMKAFSDSLKNIAIPITAEHGNYCASNIIINSNSVYVTNWEFYKENGNPLFDIIVFLLNLVSDSSLNSIKIDGKWHFSKIFKISLLEYSKATNFTPEFILQAFSYVILRYLKHRDMEIKTKTNKYSKSLELLILWERLCYLANDDLLSRL